MSHALASAFIFNEAIYNNISRFIPKLRLEAEATAQTHYVIIFLRHTKLQWLASVTYLLLFNKKIARVYN